MNPFRHGCVVDCEYFCPRPELERHLRSFAESGALGRPPEQKYQSEGGGFVKPPPLQLREKSQACYLTIGVKV